MISTTQLNIGWLVIMLVMTWLAYCVGKDEGKDEGAKGINFTKYAGLAAGLRNLINQAVHSWTGRGPATEPRAFQLALKDAETLLAVLEGRASIITVASDQPDEWTHAASDETD